MITSACYAKRLWSYQTNKINYQKKSLITILNFSLFLSTFFVIYIYPLLILTLADCLLDSGPHSSIFYVWSILRYVPDHNYIFFTALYYWREWYDVHWRGHQISVEKSIRISSCFTCLRKIVDYLLSDQKDSRVYSILHITLIYLSIY